MGSSFIVLQLRFFNCGYRDRCSKKKKSTRHCFDIGQTKSDCESVNYTVKQRFIDRPDRTVGRRMRYTIKEGEQ